MGSRERLALMNSLSSEIQDAIILDLFAGTGTIGLEALSRGAKSVDFIENHPAAIHTLLKNIQNLNLESETKIFSQSVFNFKPTKIYNIIFADPPYPLFLQTSKHFAKPQKNYPNKIGNMSLNKTLINKLNFYLKFTNNLFVLSHPDIFNPSLIEASLLSTRKFASANISVFSKK